MSEIITATRIGVEVCVKYLAPTKNLHKGIERQGNILDLVLENAMYFDKETRHQLEEMQETLEEKRVNVADGRASVGWKYFFRNLSCITKARAFASLTSVKLAETQTLSIQARRTYEARQNLKSIVSSQSLSITLDNVELSKGTTSLELPLPLNKDYVVSATIYLRPAEGTTETSVAIPDNAQFVTLNGTMDLFEHALSEKLNGEGSCQGQPDIEVAFRDMTCTVVS